MCKLLLIFRNNLDNSQISQENASTNSVNEDESHENEQNAINDEQELINKHKSSITTIEADNSTTADHLKDINTLSPVTDEEAVGTTTIMATTQDSTT